MSIMTELPLVEMPLANSHRENDSREDKIEALKSHPLFFQLSQKRQDFVIAFMQSRNPRRAALKAFQCADDKNADYQARKVLKSWMVRKLLTEIGGFKFDGYLLSLDEALYLVSNRLRDSSTDSKTFSALMALISRMCSWEQAASPAKKETVETQRELSVDDLVQQIERGNRGTNETEE